MKRIQSICQRLGTRFIGQGDFHNEPMIIMTFLPVYTDRGKGYLSKLSKATIKLLKKHNVIPDYDIITLNDDGKGKKDIEDARNRARISGKSKYGTLKRLFQGIVDLIRVKIIINKFKHD